MNKIIFCLAIILVLISNNVSATAVTEMMKGDGVFLNSVGDFVIRITTDHNSEMYRFVRAMMLGFAFIGTAWAFIKWALKADDEVDLIIYIVSAFLIFSFYVNYHVATNAFWGFSDGIASGIQKEAVGESDPYYLGGSLLTYIERLWVTDVSIFDGISAIGILIKFKIFTAVLSFFLALINAWNMWGYAFCKIIGLIFIPLLFLKPLATFFVKWVQLFLGFWFFNVFSKVALSVFHIYFVGVFGAITDVVEYNPIADQIVLSQMSLHFLIGILFLISSAAVSSSMASGIGQIATKSASGVRGAAAAAGAARKAITKGVI